MMYLANAQPQYEARNLDKATKIYEIGDWVYCGLYGGKYGVICAIHGEQSPETVKTVFFGAGVAGGRAYFDVVFDNGGYSSKVPEGIVRGVQWEVLDRPRATAEEIQQLLAFRDAEVARKKAEAQAAADAFAAEVARLREDPAFAHFEQTDPAQTGYFDGQKLANKNMRIALKKAFPSVKFTVKKNHYQSTWVSWPKASGITREQVRDVVGQFKTGYYDIESDYHGSKDAPFNKVFGGVDYMTIQEDW